MSSKKTGTLKPNTAAETTHRPEKAQIQGYQDNRGTVSDRNQSAKKG